MEIGAMRGQEGKRAGAGRKARRGRLHGRVPAARGSGRARCERQRAKAAAGQNQRPGAAAMVCSFGATRVGMLLERVRLHLRTQRFLALRRGDAVWEASCDYAGLAIGQLASRLRPEALERRLEKTGATGGAGAKAARRLLWRPGGSSRVAAPRPPR